MLFGEQVHLRPFAFHPLLAGSCRRSGAQCPAGWREAVKEVPVFWRNLEEPRMRAWSPLQWRQHPWATAIVPVGIRRWEGAAGQNVSGDGPQTGRPTQGDIDRQARSSESEKDTPERQPEVKGTLAKEDNGTPWLAKIDMSDFRPEDIKVGSVEGGFRVDATRETPWRGGGVFRMQISRVVEMPADVDKKNVRIWLAADSILNFAEQAGKSSTLETNGADPTQAVNGTTSEDDPKKEADSRLTVEKPKKEATSQGRESDSDPKDSGMLSDSTHQIDDPMDAAATCEKESDTDATRGIQAPEKSTPVTVPVEKNTDDTTTSDGHNGEIEMDNANSIIDKIEGTNDVHNTTEKAVDAHDITHKMDTVNETIFKMGDLTDVTDTKDDVPDVSEEIENKYDVITMEDVNDVTSHMDAEADVSDELPEFLNHVIEGDNDVTSNEDLILTQAKDAHFRKCMDVSGFDPSDLMIKVVDRTVAVEAERQEDVDGVETLRRISCSFQLPPGVDADSIRSAVTSDGNLTIFGHLESKTNPKEKIVSIQRVS